MTARSLVLAAGAALLLLLPGCSEAPRTHRVDIREFVYVPDSLEVAPGDTVLFVNHDVVPHTATARDSAWDTGAIAPRDSVAISVPSGSNYFCAFHPTMMATVAVRP